MAEPGHHAAPFLSRPIACPASELPAPGSLVAAPPVLHGIHLTNGQPRAPAGFLSC